MEEYKAVDKGLLAGHRGVHRSVEQIIRGQMVLGKVIRGDPVSSMKNR